MIADGFSGLVDAVLLVVAIALGGSIAITFAAAAFGARHVRRTARPSAVCGGTMAGTISTLFLGYELGMATDLWVAFAVAPVIGAAAAYIIARQFGPRRPREAGPLQDPLS
jgi:hypothetical protein